MKWLIQITHTCSGLIMYWGGGTWGKPYISTAPLGIKRIRYVEFSAVVPIYVEKVKTYEKTKSAKLVPAREPNWKGFKTRV